MSDLHSRERNQFLSVVSFLIPVLLFIVILTLKIPSSFSQIFQVYSVFLFLIIISFYYLTFRLPGNWGWLAGFGLTMLIFALTLSYQWTSGFSNNLVIGGLLPYKDGYSYYTVGAQMLLNGLPIPSVWSPSAGRPLFPGLLSSLLFFANQNLQWALAAMVAMAAAGCYWAARQVQDSLGRLAAAIYITLLYFYIQPLIGTTMSELPGLVFGCLGFVLLWKAGEKLQLRNLIFGIVVLMVGISIRAGAFLVFPILVVWAGWAFRGDKRFSYRIALIAALTSFGAFVLANTLYPRLVVAPGGATFGNFTFSLYGQVLGGAGWHRAIVDLQTHDPNVIYQAAFDFFLKHPLSLFIGIAKSYRDFFLPGDAGIFSFYSPGGPSWLDILFWFIGVVSLTWGTIKSFRGIRSPIQALLAAGWIGIFLSIPFLPPVDGGRRFYASTMAFFFALPTFAISGFFQKRQGRPGQSSPSFEWPIWAVSGLLVFLTVIFPVILRSISPLPNIAQAVCAAKQIPFVLRVNPGSYIDLIPESAGACGLAPGLCLKDFKANGAEKSVDDFYQKLVALAETDGATMRIVPGINLIDQSAHYFVGAPSQLEPLSPERLVSGCATETRTTNQSIYKIQTVVHP